MSPTPTELLNQRLSHVERQQASSQARDATHTARIDALNEKVDTGFKNTRQDVQDARRDIGGLRSRMWWMTFIVGGLCTAVNILVGYPVVGAGDSSRPPAIVQHAKERRVAPSPSPSLSPSPRPEPSIGDARQQP